MLINRNNYETFFLLYADDELRAEERTAVENFVSENEDLRGELKMTLAAVLPADEVSFSLKNSLFKNSFVDGSLQEKLLLKIDGELSAEELNELNESIAANASAVKEEQLLSATKLDLTEIITFPYKELLYKKERDKAVVFRMIRWAAAAVFIGFGLFFGFSILNKNALPDNTIAVIDATKPTNNKQSNNVINGLAKVTISNTEEDNNNKDQNALVATKIVTIKKDNAPKVLDDKISLLKQTVLASNKEVQKVLSSAKNTDVENQSQTAIASINYTEQSQSTIITIDNIIPLETTYAQAVSFDEIEQSNNKILYMDEEDVRRSKVGGVFKKFKRMIERTAKIRTGNPIRIAGFQIGTN